MPYQYIRLDRNFITGTMYVERSSTKLLFLGLILDCTDGVVTGTREHFSRAYNLDLDEVNLGFERLMAPDPESTSPAEDGRRIVPVEGVRNTFRIVNFHKYQPALSSGDGNKPKIDPGVPRDHPDYQKIYQRMRRERLREQADAEKALNEDLAGLSGVNSATNVNKENETKGKETTKPPKAPRERVTRGASKKALRCKGTPEFDDRWGEFFELYPRRPDGRSVALAEARPILEMLVLEAEEDFDKILDGLRRYAANLKARNEQQFIKQATTWLNNRCWEESYTIDPNSEIGKDLAAREALERSKRRESHKQQYTPAYESWLRDLAIATYEDHPEFAEAFQNDLETKIQRRKAANLGRRALEFLEEQLTDPKARLDGIVSYWKDQNAGDTPSFWTWDKEHNPERFAE